MKKIGGNCPIYIPGQENTAPFTCCVQLDGLDGLDGLSIKVSGNGPNKRSAKANAATVAVEKLLFLFP